MGSTEWELDEQIEKSRKQEAELARVREERDEAIKAASELDRAALEERAAREKAEAERDEDEAVIERLRVERMPEMHNPDHVAPFSAFVRAMADELRANAHKGDRAAWLKDEPRVLVSEVLYHAAKLSYALRQYRQGDGEPERVVEFAADVANMAMMVADSAGVLVRDAPLEGDRGE